MNGDITGILNLVKERLAGSGFLNGCSVITGFPSAIKDVPLKRSVVAVSVGSVELKEGAVGRFFGKDSDGVEMYGREGVIGIRADIAVPRLSGGEVCHEILTSLTSALFEGELGGRVVSVKAGGVDFDRTLGALVLPVTISLSAVIGGGQADSGEMFSRFVIKQKTEAI